MAYNGWKNRETWNVALWIGNDEGLYRAAKEFMRTYKGRQPYHAWCEHMGFSAHAKEKTPDGVMWCSKALSYSELNRMMREL